MIIYILLFFYLFACVYLFKKNKKLMLISLFIPLVILCSIRSINLGLSDTKVVYYNYFNNMLNMPLMQVIKSRGFDETLFFGFFKLFMNIYLNYRFILIILCLPYFYFVAKHIYKYSNNYLISIIVFISMYYLFSFYLIKQCIAIGILVFSYQYIIEKKPLKFLLTVLVATFIHKMSLIFLLAYPFANKKKFNKYNYLIIFIAFIIGSFFPRVVISLIGKFDYTGTLIKYMNYGIYTTGVGMSAIGGFLISVVELIFCHIFCKEDGDFGKTRWNVDLNLMTLGCVFFSFSSVVVEFYRVSLFFSIFCITRISNLSKKLSSKNKFMLNTVVCLIFILYFLFISINNYNANPFVSMWGD